MLTDSLDWLDRAWVHAWQIAALVVLVGLAVKVVGRRHPHLAYALWMVPLVKCLVPAVPLLPVDAWSWLPIPSVRLESSPLARNVAAGHVRSPLQDPHGTDASLHTVGAGDPRGNSRETTSPNDDVHAVTSGVVPAWLGIAGSAIWLAGTVLFVGAAWGRARERRTFLTELSSPPEEPVERLALRLERQLGLRWPVTILLTDCPVGPAVAGMRDPVVYLPRTLAASLSPAQLEAMIAHELIHVRRRDVWVARMQFLAQAAWWFHPAVWWMNRQIDRHRERCCDEEVLATLEGSRADYARCLVDVLSAKKKLNPLPWYPGARPVEITARRLEEIMKRANMIHRRSPAWCWCAAGLLALAVLPGARPPLGANEPSFVAPKAVVLPATSAEADSADDFWDKLLDVNLPQSDEATNEAKNAVFVDVDTTTVPILTKDGIATPEQRRTHFASMGILAYGDGKADGRKSFADSGHMVRFELPDGVEKIRGIRIHGSRYGYPRPPKEDFEITLVSDDFSETLDTEKAPYSLFDRGDAKYVPVNFKQPVALPKAFWVIVNFNAEQTKGVYVSYDTSTEGKYSRVGLPGDKEPRETDFKGDWMMQVLTVPAK